ncbi:MULTISPECIES: ribonuclease HII [unclassified Granulicatella]|uniref:ribonuclease HII n=1 Tax=unclassified Granulicatella TaxID=2630493 RepID=UPI0010734851|nr:ribonuclease HII [Granulicatella sp. WM01]MBF0781037.1 ribonuclease HII [Granulicatella sp. 19428wC4_WM01]TFU92451.1 ribonuclease HII [Granulicatella sp. WM01]
MQSVKEIIVALQTINDESQLCQVWLTDSRKGVQSALEKWRKKQEKSRQEQVKLQEMLRYEKELYQSGYHLIAGIDEVGRGPLAGPVVAACVIMPMDDYILGVNDSKQLSPQKREALYAEIIDKAISVGIGIIEPNVIDDINIYQATKLAMIQAIQQIDIIPDYLLIDAMNLDIAIPQKSLIKGDANSYQIACASIVAKVTRDRLMSKYAEKYPHYDFEHNAGYGTTKHLEGLRQYGVSAIHRKTFEPIKSMLNK